MRVFSMARPEQRMGLQQHPTILAPVWLASSQNPANRGATDLQAAGDLGFAGAGAIQLSHLRGMVLR